VGIRYLNLDRGLMFHGGYRRNSNFNFSFPDNIESDRFVFRVSYTQPVEGVLTNSSPLVVLEAPSDQVSVGDSLEITATAFDADNDDLIFAWTTTGGQIMGESEAVTFDASGLAPGPLYRSSPRKRRAGRV
jgi:hypothetical protein